MPPLAGGQQLLPRGVLVAAAAAVILVLLLVSRSFETPSAVLVTTSDAVAPGRPTPSDRGPTTSAEDASDGTSQSEAGGGSDDVRDGGGSDDVRDGGSTPVDTSQDSGSTATTTTSSSSSGSEDAATAAADAAATAAQLQARLDAAFDAFWKAHVSKPGLSAVLDRSTDLDSASLDRLRELLLAATDAAAAAAAPAATAAAALGPYDALNWDLPALSTGDCFMAGTGYDLCRYESVCIDVPPRGGGEGEGSGGGTAEEGGVSSSGSDAVPPVDALEVPPADAEEGAARRLPATTDPSFSDPASYMHTLMFLYDAQPDTPAPDAPPLAHLAAADYQNRSRWVFSVPAADEGAPSRDWCQWPAALVKAATGSGSATPSSSTAGDGIHAAWQPDPIARELPPEALEPPTGPVNVCKSTSPQGGRGRRLLPYGSRLRSKLTARTAGLPREWGGTSPLPVHWVDSLWLIDDARHPVVDGPGALTHLFALASAHYHSRTALPAPLPPLEHLYIVNSGGWTGAERPSPSLRADDEPSPLLDPATSKWLELGLQLLKGNEVPGPAELPSLYASEEASLAAGMHTAVAPPADGSSETLPPGPPPLRPAPGDATFASMRAWTRAEVLAFLGDTLPSCCPDVMTEAAGAEEVAACLPLLPRCFAATQEKAAAAADEAGAAAAGPGRLPVSLLELPPKRAAGTMVFTAAQALPPPLRLRHGVQAFLRSRGWTVDDFASLPPPRPGDETAPPPPIDAPASTPIRLCAKHAVALGPPPRGLPGSFNDADYVRMLGRQLFSFPRVFHEAWGEGMRPIPAAKVVVIPPASGFEGLEGLLALLAKYEVNDVTVATLPQLAARSIQDQATLIGTAGLLITAPGPHIGLTAFMARRSEVMLLHGFAQWAPAVVRGLTAMGLSVRPVWSRLPATAPPRGVTPDAWAAAVTRCGGLPLPHAARDAACVSTFAAAPVRLPLAEAEWELLRALEALDVPRAPRNDPLSVLIGLPQDGEGGDRGVHPPGWYAEHSAVVCPTGLKGAGGGWVCEARP